MDPDDDDRNGSTPSEKVGYRNPPKHTRWKKGQSGNPQGREKNLLGAPPTRRRFLDVLLEEAHREVKVVEGGKEVLLPKMVAMARQHTNNAVKDPRWMRWLLPLLHEAEKDLPKEGKDYQRYDLSKLSIAELEQFQALLKKCVPEKG